MAFFVEDDKEPEGKYSFYTCVSNGKEYKYEKQVADAIFTKHSFSQEDSMSMLEMTACNSKDTTITEADLEAGANGLIQWKEAAAAAAEAERVKKMQDAERARQEYEAAMAAAAEAEKAEAEAKRAKEEQARKDAEEAAKKKTAPKPTGMFGKMKAFGNKALDAADKATRIAIAAAEAGWDTARQANIARQAQLQEAKAKNDAAAAAAKKSAENPGRPLTFYEQVQLNAKIAAKEAKGLAGDAQKGLEAMDKTVNDEIAKNGQGETKSL
jgi:hypothetical protein